MAGLGEASITVHLTGEASPEIKALIRQCVKEALADEFGEQLKRIADKIESQIEVRPEQGVATNER